MSKVVAFAKERQHFEPACIPPGIYQLAYIRHRIVKRFDRDVLESWFTVADYGEHFGKQLVRYYNVQASAKRRSFTARPGGEFVRDYCTVFGKRPQFDLAPIRDFKGCYVRGFVDTVTTDYRQRKLPDAMHYSIVRELLGKEA